MSASALPSKLFFRIGEVASLVGVEPHVLRYWEREFRSIRPTKSAKGQRVYSRKDVENLLRVRDLLYRDGFTIAGAKKRLQRGPATHEDGGAEAEAESHAAPDEDELSLAPDTDTDLRAETDSDDEVAASEPQSGARSHVHAKLSELRAEVQGFLDELETPDALVTGRP
jgi:DNA-binding transcriptional MerR regulator